MSPQGASDRWFIQKALFFFFPLSYRFGNSIRIAGSNAVPLQSAQLICKCAELNTIFAQLIWRSTLKTGQEQRRSLNAVLAQRARKSVVAGLLPWTLPAVYCCHPPAVAGLAGFAPSTAPPSVAATRKRHVIERGLLSIAANSLLFLVSAHHAGWLIYYWTAYLTD